MGFFGVSVFVLSVSSAKKKKKPSKKRRWKKKKSNNGGEIQSDVMFRTGGIVTVCRRAPCLLPPPLSKITPFPQLNGVEHTGNFSTPVDDWTHLANFVENEPTTSQRGTTWNPPKLGHNSHLSPPPLLCRSVCFCPLHSIILPSST